MPHTTIRWAAFVAGAALALSACGQSKDTGGDGSDGKAAPKDKATPAKVKLVKAPFCAKLDKRAMKAALDAPRPLKMTRQLRPGQKYTSFPGTPKQTATGWSCEFSTPYVGSKEPRVGLYASISGTPYTEASFTKYLKDRDRFRDKAAKCTQDAADRFGDHGVVLSCSKKTRSTKSSYAPGYSDIAYRGLADGSLILCGVDSSDDQALDQLKGAAEELCSDFMDAVTR